MGYTDYLYIDLLPGTVNLSVRVLRNGNWKGVATPSVRRVRLNLFATSTHLQRNKDFLYISYLLKSTGLIWLHC